MQAKPVVLAHRPHVVIIGAGFAGLSTTRALANSPVDVMLIDRSNHHLFQPLLYQVATAALSPAQIAQPVRAIVKNQQNCTVALGEVTNVDIEKKLVCGHHANVSWDYLVIATGATHTWFNHVEWAPYAPGFILWCAGVKATPAAEWLKAKQDNAGRVLVSPDLSIPGHTDIFVIGDVARIVDANGITVPGLCPAAEQQGKYVAHLIDHKIRGLPPPSPFTYADYGTMATIGRGKAVAEIRGLKFSGLFAWILWGAIHLMPLVGFRNRLVVALDWFWAYLTRSRGVRLITAEQQSDSDL